MRMISLIACVCLCAVLFVSAASAQQCGPNGCRGPNRNFGLRQVVVGNQIVTLDQFGNVRNRQFLNGNNRVNNNSLLNLNLNSFGSRSLSERLLFGF